MGGQKLPTAVGAAPALPWGHSRDGWVPTAAPCRIKSQLLRAHAPCRSDLSPHNTQEVPCAQREEVILYLNNKTPTTFYLHLNYDPSLLSLRRIKLDSPGALPAALALLGAEARWPC